MPKKLDCSIDASSPSLSETRPLFVDNRNGNTLDRAILQHLRALRDEQALPFGLDIASAFFNLQGFDLIAEELERVGKVRLLLGADPLPESKWPMRRLDDPPEPEFTQRQVEQALSDLERGLARSRDLLPFDDRTETAVDRLLRLLRGGKIEVRRYERQYLHAKAFIFRVGGGGMLVGSSNLTQAGLRGSLELNLGNYIDPVISKVEGWFDELWDEAVPYDLAAIFERLNADYTPYEIYLRVLYELYGAELEAETAAAGGEIPITTFQKHGVWRALGILEKFGGVIIADGVGLGKTFVAGDIIRQFRERRQRVLLICPAALRDSTWKKFMTKYQQFVECYSYEQLARDRQLGGEAVHLQCPLDDYQLVVVDEAHNYRNPGSPSRAGVLRHLLKGPRRDLVLLSATPVNNSLWDLYHLLSYFVKQDAAFADHGVLSLHAHFRRAMDEDPFSLNPDLLFPIIDATTVKRTRDFIKRYYANDLITIDGVAQQIRFPRPVPLSINYNLDEVLPGFFDELEQGLATGPGGGSLTLARYQTENYLLGTDAADRQDNALVGLIRTGLLKRFESSVHAFARTMQKMVGEHELFLKMLAEGKVVSKVLMRELAAADDDDAIEELEEAHGHAANASEYDADALRAAVEADHALLLRWLHRADAVSAALDPKLAALVNELETIAGEAANEAIDAEDERRKRKVLIFSYYEDTIDWIEGFLRAQAKHDPRLAPYHGRIASVAGHDTRHGVTRQQAVNGFAPESAAPGEDDLFDVLLCTDVLAEGMNLQQCRNVINFDLPWNPMRLVQRHGRIDRIGSKHERVFLRTFFPDQQLNRILDLENKVRQKLARAARSVGVEHSPIEDGDEGNQAFSETREEIERLRNNDASLFERGGTAGAAQSGEEYRQELRRALAAGRFDIAGLPWKAGSGLAKGKARGHFFCARVADRVFLRFVPLGAEEDSAIVHELATCLRMIECTEKTPYVMPDDLHQSAHLAWETARRHIHSAWMFETDPANLHPRVSKLNRELAEFIRDNPPGDVEQNRLQRVLDAIEAPTSRRNENLLRAIFQSTFEDEEQKSRAIVAEVEAMGLEPFAAPNPRPVISPEDIHLVCWMAIESS
jgi:hypothetical protein